MVTAFEKGWNAVEDYDELSSAMEDFVGRMEADEAEFEAEVLGEYMEEGGEFTIDDFRRVESQMEDWKLRKDSNR